MGNGDELDVTVNVLGLNSRIVPAVVVDVVTEETWAEATLAAARIIPRKATFRENLLIVVFIVFDWLWLSGMDMPLQKIHGIAHANLA